MENNKTILLTMLAGQAFTNKIDMKTYPLILSEEEKLYIKLTKGSKSLTYIYDLEELLTMCDIKEVMDKVLSDIESNLL